jgi:hypothetical protein
MMPEGVSPLSLRGLVLVLASFFVWAPHSANADAIYQYTGNPFTIVISPYTTADSVSGTIQLSAALPPNTDGLGSIKLDGYSFTDGVQTLTSMNSSILGNNGQPGNIALSTDGSGAITHWIIGIVTTLVGMGPEIFTEDVAPNPISTTTAEDIGALGMPGSSGSNADTPGTWTLVPEPSTLTISAIGLSVLAAAPRRRIA